VSVSAEGGVGPLALSAPRHIDPIVATIALPLTLLATWVVIWGHVSPADFEGVQGGAYFLLLYRLFGPAGPLTAMALFIVWFGSVGVGAAWRTLDRRPVLVADADGLALHPSFARDRVPWREVERIVFTGSNPGCLEFRLTRRIWTVSAPLTSTRLRIDRNLLGLSTREVRRLVPRLNRLKRAAQPVRACRDPGVAG
jgi:hypothetical protein